MQAGTLRRRNKFVPALPLATAVTRANFTFQHPHFPGFALDGPPLGAQEKLY
jgi:hypothetical protein